MRKIKRRRISLITGATFGQEFGKKLKNALHLRLPARHIFLLRTRRKGDTQGVSLGGSGPGEDY
jgi:hypothetical protein